MIKINNTEISDIKINDTSVSKVMVGGTAAWEKSQLGPSSYIQNGLVFQLDGINKGNNIGYWTDLIGGIKYDLSDADSVENNCVVFDKSPLTGDATLPYILEKPTIEIVMLLDNDNWLNQKLSVFYSKVASGGGVGNLTSTTLIKTSSKEDIIFGLGRWECIIFQYQELPQTVLISYRHNVSGDGSNEKRICLNGQCKDADDRGWDLSSLSPGEGVTGSWIGGVPNANELFEGKIYAIRIYSRPLSDLEMKYNQEIDAQRFGLTISASDNN